MCLLVLSLVACGQRDRCEKGLCPSGTVCDPETGLCKEKGGHTDDATIGFIGSFSAAAMPGLKQGFVGFVPEVKSLAFVERDHKQSRTTFIAGPAAGASQQAAGEVSALAIGLEGTVHIAFSRKQDGTLWYAKRKAESWGVKQVSAFASGTVGDRIALTLWQGRPAVVVRTVPDHALVFCHMDSQGVWKKEVIPQPVAVVGETQVDLGASLAVTTKAGSVAVLSYDAVARGLVLALRNDGGWLVERLAAAG